MIDEITAAVLKARIHPETHILAPEIVGPHTTTPRASADVGIENRLDAPFRVQVGPKKVNAQFVMGEQRLILWILFVLPPTLGVVPDMVSRTGGSRGGSAAGRILGLGCQDRQHHYRSRYHQCFLFHSVDLLSVKVSFGAASLRPLSFPTATRQTAQADRGGPTEEQGLRTIIGQDYRFGS